MTQSPTSGTGVVDRLRSAVWGPASTRIRQSQALREPAIGAYRAVARVVLRGTGSPIFANSIPKSGTHLLTQLLSATPGVWFSGLHVIDKDFRPDQDSAGDGLGPFDATAFARRMRSLRPGQFATAHIGAFPGMTDTLARLGLRHVLMIRDPRDIAVSLAFYLSSNERLHMQERFAALGDTDALLRAAITGLPAAPGSPPVPSLGERLEKYAPLLDDPETCVVRFEDLVGAAGGSTAERQHEAIRRIMLHCGRDASEPVVARVAGQTFAKHSATFRRGTIGDWTNHFTEAHLALLDEVAPGALAVFGYA